VAEAVIRACKTRTRPIVITALALVAGSSVIFTDPIFQGMAISLASGVLVSTVLTLIVIPLGCVAASKDLCEVAAVIPPAGTSMPYATAAAKEKPKVEQEPKKGEPRPGVLAKVWDYLKEGAILGFYLIRGLFLLLYDFLKGLVKKKQPTPKPPAASDTGGGDRPDGSGTPPTAWVSGSDNAPVSTLADSAAVTTERAPSEPVETVSIARTEETDAPAAREGAADTGAQKDTASDAAGERASKPRTDPAVTAEQDTSAAQKETIGKATADATRKERAATKKSVAKKATAKPKTAKPASIQKKPRRRGIRLKADGEL